MGRKDWDYVSLPKLLVKRLDQFLEMPRAKSMGMTSKSELLRKLINEYLDEQEAFYNKLESIGDFLLHVNDRDHLILTYNDESQLQEIVCKFIERGVKNNEINILNIFKEEESIFMQALQKGGVNVDALFNSHDLMIIPSDECFHEGKFSGEPFVKALDLVSDIAKRRGKSGLNILCTTPAKLIEQGKYEDALRDEEDTHKLIPKYGVPLTVLCVYRSIPQPVEQHLLEFHDIVIKHVVTAKETGLL